ncbi:ACP S-malonyltransferase [Undibacterium sp. SXout11W]|uniref:ACP S-malonyltransferase n=1 Tax=Undibacterium sp. SXout11W TaxID=3413050 RepID=UPI003BF072ED
MPRFALLCPGQGGQEAHMFAIANSNPRVAALLDQFDTSQYFGMPLTALLASPSLMFENRFAQPLIVAATLANWLALREELPPPDVIAGYSVGEVSAHAISGELDVGQAIHLASIRATAMQSCVKPQAAHAMLSVSGLPLAPLQEICFSHHLYIAIVTGETNAIIAGLRDDILKAEQALRAHAIAQLHLSLLPVHIASHTPLMADALPTMKQVLDKLPFQAITTPVLAGVNAMKSVNSAESKQSLLAQMTQTIRWHECMDGLDEAGMNVVLELGPGSALSRMLQSRHPHIACRSVADFRSSSAVAEWVRRQMLRD